MAISFTLHRLFLLIAAVSILSSVGCTATPLLNKILLIDTDAEEQAAAEAFDLETPHVTVVLVAAKGKQRRAHVPFQDGMLVSDVLQHTRALKKFRRERIDVMRNTPRDYRPLRMTVKYDQKKQRVATGSDYTLHPGDIIQVMEDNTSAIDDVLGNAIGPVGARAVHANMPGV